MVAVLGVDGGNGAAGGRGAAAADGARVRGLEVERTKRDGAEVERIGVVKAEIVAELMGKIAPYVGGRGAVPGQDGNPDN